MAANSKLAVAIHVMTSLAYGDGAPMTSQRLAKSVNTNPVVIRRLLSQLHKAGLIKAQAGNAGGAQLARSSKTITLLDICRAIQTGMPFEIPSKPENKACAVACRMKSLLSAVFTETEAAMAKSLRKVKLSDLVAELPSMTRSAA